jgi:hypothetical protein
MRLTLLCLVYCLLAATLHGQPPLPRYEARRAAAPIVVDGKLDDKAWTTAPAVELIFPWDSQTGIYFGL